MYYNLYYVHALVFFRYVMETISACVYFNKNNFRIQITYYLNDNISFNISAMLSFLSNNRKSKNKLTYHL